MCGVDANMLYKCNHPASLLLVLDSHLSLPESLQTLSHLSAMALSS